MLKLHVWGDTEQVSVISPACIAAVWIADLVSKSKGIDIDVVVSNNTNLSPIGELPVLIDGEIKFSGYKQICSYLISKNGPETQLQRLSSREAFLDDSVICHLENTLDIIHQYNLYSNRTNYEQYTRKLVARYYPFPMMYNQSLRLYKCAQERVKLLGLDKEKSSFFNFSKTQGFDDDFDDDDEIRDYSMNKDFQTEGISELHKRFLSQKSQTKEMVRESSNCMRCLMIIDKSLKKLQSLWGENSNNGGSGGYLFGALPSTCDILLLAYMYCLTCKELPDRFIFNFLDSKKDNAFVQNILQKIKHLELSLPSVKKPETIEVPSLYNEILFWTGFIRY
ncbi:SAM37 [Candida oxycetoniae]|uniref:SAM37 n=1 Tax=Candida oxycetoniae TaxID=497107 RepID=A0AAI9SWK0_9ASCO|nr:SAM37 [Candida oxycetoniae]KAI3404403.2 SAM37 [Candida oxycetoniae]